jgi:hypothetical protein
VTSGSLLAGRWEILRPLGPEPAGAPRGAERPREALLARELSSGREVVVKLLHLDRMSGWKELEIFQREAEALKGIRHTRIPALLEAFRLEDERAPVFVLVREFVPGASLQEKVGGGWRATESQIMRIGAELAGIVAFLHDLRPPVIHRDINPNNVILGDDGEVHLVDFGGVQDPYTGGGTVIGTPGYAAFEQFVGRATPRSDLYAVAATLLFLLTHRNPADLPSAGLKPDFRSAAASAPLVRVLDNWLEPDQEKRTLAAGEAAALLARGAEGAPAAAEPEERSGVRRDAGIAPPPGSRIRVSEVPGGVEFRVPERGRGPGALALAGFAVFWLGFVGFWTHAAIAMRAPLFFPLFSIPFWCIGLLLAGWALKGLFGSVTISLGPGGLTFTRRLLFRSRSFTVPLSEAGPCVFDEGRGRSIPSGGALRLEAGARVLVFGGGLSRREGQWLQEALNDRLGAAGGALTALGRQVHPGS